jgi:DNA-binding transcriptional MerR regulator
VGALAGAKTGRDAILSGGRNKSKGRSTLHNKTVDDRKVFPFSLVNAHHVWKLALEKTKNGEKDRSTGRRRFHPHVLRKFFRTKMAQLIPVDVTEALMGHEGYLTEVYRRYTEEDLAKFYKQGEQDVSIFGTSNEQISQMWEEFSKQQTIINNVLTENMTLRQSFRELEEKQNLTQEALTEGMRELHDFMGQFMTVVYQSLPDMEEREQKLKEIFQKLQEEYDKKLRSTS